MIGSLRHLVKDISPELERQALTLGWCIEWVRDTIYIRSMCVYIRLLYIEHCHDDMVNYMYSFLKYY